MLNVRLAWDPDKPLVASRGFEIGGRIYKDGDPFPWRERGIAERDVCTMWHSRFVHHPTPASVGAPASPPPVERKRGRAAR